MGHLPIVDLATIENIIETGYISIRANLKTLIEKTVADLFSDILVTRVGDLIYPWIIKKEMRGAISYNDPDLLGFRFRFEVAGPPIFVNGDEFPIKFPVRTNYRTYETLKEEDALDIFQEELLWNAIGKKSLRRGRGITHQSPREDEILEEMLGNYRDSVLERVNLVGVPITINLNQTLQNLEEDSLNYLIPFPDDMKLRNVIIEQVPWVNGNEFKTEKAMEAWLMENIDSVDNRFQDFFLEDSQLIWFANYLPYGVSGKNIDVVTLHAYPSGVNFANVIELKKGRLSKSSLTSTIEQVKKYSIFIKKAFRMEDDQVYPYILCQLNTKNARDLSSITHLKNFHMNDVRIIGYEINDGNIIFEEI